MGYDEELAKRIRELVADEADVTEKRMFGGLAFLVGGNMSVAVSGQGGLMVRVDPGDTDALAAKPHRHSSRKGGVLRRSLRAPADRPSRVCRAPRSLLLQCLLSSWSGAPPAAA